MSGTKYIFVTGGVTSSLGKGIIAASLGKLLQARGYSVTIQKFDPYINVDPGTLNPYEHGECYVTDDGAETDLDLGHYERFLNITTSQSNNVTTGRIYNDVIQRERKGNFLGKTVQVVPHITDEIKLNFYKLGQNDDFDFVITEIGGCVGDIESLPFIEAVRQARLELGPNRFISLHLTLVPFLKAAGELKTKPTQHSVKDLLEAGIQPDILVCRTEHTLSLDIRRKVALFCNVPQSCVIEAIDAESIYDVPLIMRKERLDERVLQKLNIKINGEPEISRWKAYLGKLKNPSHRVDIGLVGKYVKLKDSYKSIIESFTHAGTFHECYVNIHWIHAEDISYKNTNKLLSCLDGILVAPGFGERGIDGKIEAVRYARENEIPFFGICLGMQCAVIEFARNILEIKDAHTSEINPETSSTVIDLMKEQKNIKSMGGTMRLGAYKCELKKGSLVQTVYNKNQISERHRHRYEFNDKYLKEFEGKGLMATGINPYSKLVEIIELVGHPWFVGTQFHPELKSTVINPHPLFVGFIKAAMAHKKKVTFE